MAAIYTLIGGHTMRLNRILTVLLVFLIAAGPALAADSARVARLNGPAWVDGAVLTPGAVIAEGSRVTTGGGTRLELRFVDDTVLILGENADLRIDRFVYTPDGSAQLRVGSGAFLVATGAVAKLPGHPFRVVTPIASIGVRGTRFWGGSLSHPLDVLLLEGAVSVRSNGGAVDLTAPLEGTDVASPDAPPTPAGRWGAERVEQALQSVRFD